MIAQIKEKLLENWILKALAILLAWILWLFIQGEPGGIRTVIAPVEVYLPPNMEITSVLPSTVDVKIRGRSESLDCIIDFQNAEEGEQKIQLTDEKYFKSPGGMGFEVSDVNPSYITLKLEKTISKEVPISVPVQGDPLEGYEVYEKRLDPEYVVITGPRSHIEPVDEALTEIIDLTGQNGNTIFMVNLDFEDGKIRTSISDPVSVEIRIGPHRKDYTVEDVPVFLDSESYVSSPAKVRVRLMAPEYLQPALVASNFRATIATQDLKDAAFPVKVEPVIGFQDDWVDKIKVLGIRPPEVSVSPVDSQSAKR